MNAVILCVVDEEGVLVTGVSEALEVCVVLVVSLRCDNEADASEGNDTPGRNVVILTVLDVKDTID